MHTHHVRSSLTAVLTSILLAGCAVEDDTSVAADEQVDTVESEEVGTDAEAFTAGGMIPLVYSNGQGSAELGNWSGTMSFLQAVGGSFVGNGEVAVYQSGTKSRVWDKAGAGEVLRVHGAIVAPATQYSPEVLWGNNSYATTAARRNLGPADGRVCYLTQLTNITGSNFRSLSDEIRVYSDGTTWWLHGSGRASGAARCADITSFHGGNGGTNSGSPHTLGGAVTGKTCWLSAVGGDFRSTDQFNGVFINNLGSAGWSLTVSPGKKASAACGI